MHQVAVIRLFRRRPKPEVEVQFLGRRSRLLIADAPARFTAVTLAYRQLAVLARLHRQNFIRATATAALLRAVLYNAVIFLRRLNQLAALVDVVRNRLLDVGILARLAGPDSNQ